MSANKLGQYFNSKGIGAFLNTLLNSRQNFTPHVRAQSVAHINYAKLASCGIKYVVFDKDNTLTEPYVDEYFNEDLQRGILKECEKAFKIDNMAILSNSVGSKDDPEGREAKKVERTLGLKVIRHVNKKPAVSEEILQHF